MILKTLLMTRAFSRIRNYILPKTWSEKISIYPNYLLFGVQSITITCFVYSFWKKKLYINTSQKWQHNNILHEGKIFITVFVGRMVLFLCNWMWKICFSVLNGHALISGTLKKYSNYFQPGTLIRKANLKTQIPV